MTMMNGAPPTEHEEAIRLASVKAEVVLPAERR
jgi:hypothetical protein